MKQNHLLIICILAYGFWSSLSEAKAVQKLPLEYKRARKAVEVDPDGHAHDHEEAAQTSCAITEHILAEEFSRLAEELNLVGDDGTVCEIEDENHDDDDDHHNDDHDDGQSDDHHDDDDHDDHAGSTMAQNNSCETYFEFVQQLLLNLNLTTPCCLRNSSYCEEEEPAGNSRTPANQAYGYGFLMVLLVSLCSLLGVLFVPLLSKNNKWGKILYQYIYALMIALGASALFCDAILHLIPQVFGLHGHSPEEEGHEHDEEEEDKSFIWKGCVVIAGLYFFFLFEFILHTWNSHTHHHGDTSSSIDSDSTTFSHTNQKVGGHKKKSEEKCTEPEVTFPHGTCKDSSNQSAKVLHPDSNGSGDENNTQEEPCVDHSKTKSCPKKFCNYIFNIKPLAWLILLGDGVHNFADGLALGAAISQSLSLGIGTMIAIVFHEIPHEISDFVILISTGMTWYAALAFNFISALLAVLGFFVGVAVSVESAEANEWILAAAAGLFIYIALVDLLPELIHLKQKGCLRWGLFLAINIGFIISFVVLLLLAIYEDQLNDLVDID